MAKRQGSKISLEKGQYAYLSSSAMTASAVKKWLLLIPGGALTAFFGLGLLLVLTDSEYMDSSDMTVCIGILIPSVLLLVLGLRAGRNRELARRYDGVFQRAASGLVEMSELMDQTGKSSGQVLKELELLFRKGFFPGCALRRGTEAAVLLPGAQRNAGRLITVSCPHCGGSTTLRAGLPGICEYCGSSISAE